MRSGIFFAFIFVFCVENSNGQNYRKKYDRLAPRNNTPNVDRCVHGSWIDKSISTEPTTDNTANKVLTRRSSALNNKFNLCDSSTTFDSKAERNAMYMLSASSAVSSFILAKRLRPSDDNL